MQRLLDKNINTKEEYNRIYFERAQHQLDEFDIKRWQLLLKDYRGGRLIDLGCLDSQIPFLAKTIDKKSEIWGLDQANEAIADMEIKYPKIHWHCGDLYHTQFKAHYFDYAILGEVLEHLDDPQAAVKEALRILSKKGILAISVPLNEAIEPGAVDKDRHIFSFTPQDIEQLCYPYRVKFKILGSRQRPYKYHFPNLLCWINKNEYQFHQ